MKTKHANHPTTNTSHKRAGFAAILCGALLAAHSVRAFTNEFWVATNGNPSAKGTIGDPYDGSTQVNFDAVMNAMPSNCTIHILGGTYLTKGQETVWLKSGQRILGSGMDITTIKLINTNPGTVLATAPGVIGNSGIEISDLTCNANAQNNSTNTTYGGVWIVGTGTAIRRVKVKNIAHGAQGSETYGILVTGENNFNSEGNVIEDCIVMPPVAGPICSSITIYAGSNSYVSARISGNWVYGTNAAVSVQAFNICNSYNTLLTGNHFVGAGNCVGIYSDSGGNTNLMVVNNTFDNSNWGVLLANYSHSFLTFSGNIFTMQTQSNNWDAGFVFSSDGTFTNVMILGNTIRTIAWGSGQNLLAVRAWTASGVTVANNAIDNRGVFDFTGSTGVSVHDNVDLNGNFLSGTNQIGLPNSHVRTTVSGSSYTAKNTDRYIGITYSSGSTITLPSASGLPGKELIIANETSSSTANTIAASSGTVNGSASISFSGGYTSRTVISDGSNWFAR